MLEKQVMEEIVHGGWLERVRRDGAMPCELLLHIANGANFPLFSL